MSGNDGFMEFGFGQTTGLPQRNRRFKGKDNETYRMSFAWWPGLETSTLDMDAETPTFVGCTRNYIPGVGYIMNKGPEYTKIAGGPPKTSISTIIVVWPTDSKGQLDKAAFQEGRFEVMPWVFDQGKYEHMETIHGNFHLGKHDLVAKCTDSQYQKMQFSPAPENVLRKLRDSGDKGKDRFDALMGQIQNIAANIRNDLARDMSLDQIREKMGNGGGVAAPVASATTEEVDEMLDNILDG